MVQPANTTRSPSWQRCFECTKKFLIHGGECEWHRVVYDDCFDCFCSQPSKSCTSMQSTALWDYTVVTCFANSIAAAAGEVESRETLLKLQNEQQQSNNAHAL